MAQTPPITQATDLSRFAIGFDARDQARVHQLWDEVFRSERWSEGEQTRGFEQAWSGWNRLPAVAFNSWTGAAFAALEWAQVRGKTVLCPSNTFMATPLAAIHAGANVEFVDCNREDLCMSFDDLEQKVQLHRPAAVVLVHIGGHIAFDTHRIAELCAAEDPADRGLRACSRRRVGRPPPGHVRRRGRVVVRADNDLDREGGMLVSRHADAIEFAQAFRTTASLSTQSTASTSG